MYLTGDRLHCVGDSCGRESLLRVVHDQLVDERFYRLRLCAVAFVNVHENPLLHILVCSHCHLIWYRNRRRSSCCKHPTRHQCLAPILFLSGSTNTVYRVQYLHNNVLHIQNSQYETCFVNMFHISRTVHEADGLFTHH